jgi:hypothetical protein
MGNGIVISPIGSQRTLIFAAQELMRYFIMIDPEISVRIEPKDHYDGDSSALWLGCSEHLSLVSEIVVADTLLDDGIHIQLAEGKGFVSGANERSVLIGCYRLLKEAGCRFIRPGQKGEYIPSRRILDFTCNIREKPSYRHRGICIEGAVSFENVSDMIDWLPKVGMNSYFIQFREAYTFFERWYTHRDNPLLPPEEFNLEVSQNIVRKLVQEIELRGLIYHSVGHGWTCEPFGFKGLGWDTEDELEVPAEKAQYLALVEGKREIWKGVPLNTNLCYSNPEVRWIIIQDIVHYIRGNRHIDLLHLWLADGVNNHCECDHCQQSRPSDFFVMLLNELDEQLTLNKLNNQIVFLIYVDLLWAPEKEWIHNPDRFILMFAPITRSYGKTYSKEVPKLALPDYARNQLSFPNDPDVLLGFLHAWRDKFDGDSFDFDYHYMWDHFFDPGYYKSAQTICEDIKMLKHHGLNGYMSCQLQRAFLPTSLGTYVMAATLWNDGLDFEQAADDYFLHTFGEDGRLCKSYLSRLSELFDSKHIRGEKTVDEQLKRKDYEQIRHILLNFTPLIEKNYRIMNECHAESWRLLHYHAEICMRFVNVLEAKLIPDQEALRMQWGEMKRYIQQIEIEVQNVFDVYECIYTMENIMMPELMIP